MSPDIQVKQGDLDGYSKTTACIGKPDAPEFERFQFDATEEQNCISPYKNEILPSKVRSKKEVIDEARAKGAKVHFASLMDICHLKNAELEAKHLKYKGRVVLRGDIVKDDSGSYAVFTEQGSSASQMTAAKVMDIISRLPGCAGQAADAVSAQTQLKMEDAPQLLKIPKSECADVWIRLPRHKWPESWSSMEDPVVPLERHLYGNPLAGLLSLYIVKKDYSYLCMWMT